MSTLNLSPVKFQFFIETMGCKANVFDSLVMETKLRRIGGVRTQKKDQAQIFLLNSCTVTAQADQKAQRLLEQMKERCPETVTIMTGCLAEVLKNRPAPAKETNSADFSLPNSRRNQLEALVQSALRGNGVSTFALENGTTPDDHDDEVFWGQLPLDSDHTRAFLKIQEGCNDFCTYCIIPAGRGKSRSVSLEKILSEVRRLCELGLQEVVLTGTNLADYGKDFGLSFDELVLHLLKDTDLPRLRLSSLDPSEISDGLLNLMTVQYPGRLMPHFHISLQSPVSRVLRAMKRSYRTEDVRTCLKKIAAANPKIFVGMDVISGFPSETLDEHKEAMEILTELPWTRLHVFPYSERAGTPALKISGSVPQQERKRRSQELLVLSNFRHEEFCKGFLNIPVTDVLVERIEVTEDGDQKICHVLGHAPNYLRFMASKSFTEIDGLPVKRNQRVSVRAGSLLPKPTQDFTLQGDII